jgi:hypothetical protein
VNPVLCTRVVGTELRLSCESRVREDADDFLYVSGS